MRLFKNGIGNANVTGLTIGQNFLLGMFDSAYSIGDMIYSIADDPINALEGIVFILKAISPTGIITGESATFISGIVSSAEKCIEEMGDGNANTIARKLGRVVGDIVIAIIADKGVNYAKTAISESLDIGLLSKLDLTMSEGNIVKVLRQRIFLKNANCVDDLVKAGIKSSDDLIKNGIINADKLLAKGITSADDLSKLGFSSVDDLVKLNIIGEEELEKLGLNSVEELKKIGVTSGDDFARIGYIVKIETTRVGQWMSKTEYEQFLKTGEIPRTNVLTNGKEGYMKQADMGDYYVEFDIDSSLLVQKDSNLGWSLIKSKNNMYIKLVEKKGITLPDPIGTNIIHVDTKR